MNEQILQKMRHSYQSSTLNEWKLKKMPDGQLRIVVANGKDEMVIAIVNRVEDAVFIENAHRFFPGILGSIRGTVAPDKVVTTTLKETVQPATTVEKRGVGRPSRPDRVVPPAPVAPVARPVAPVTKPVAPAPIKAPVVLAPAVVVKGAAIPTVVLPAAGKLEEIK